ncbi:MAG: GNAT family N-acetyltransferase [Acidobacteria bacterium]|nr:GNAT family N-acetyltransferase [Acidobacteriota bacterium]
MRPFVSIAGVYPISYCGQRIALRELTRRDASAVHQWTGDSEAVSMIPLGPTRFSETRSYLRQIEREAGARDRRVYTLGVIELDTEDLVGSVGLTIDSAVHRRAEIGYIIRRDRWGSGLGTETARAGLEIAFDRLELHRVWAVCDTSNTVSAHVLRNVGMHHEGQLRKDLRIGDQWRDADLFGIIEDEWRSQDSNGSQS